MRLTAQDFPPEALRLFDRYVHGDVSRREFLDAAQRLLGSMLSKPDPQVGLLQFLGNGAPAVPQALQLTRALLRNQGLRGSAGFAAGFRGARYRGKRTVRAVPFDALPLDLGQLWPE